MAEIDICRDPSMDLLDSATADRCLHEIPNSEWDVVLVTPPCSTFSRARCVQPGPRPLRSRLYPLGFPWLSDSHRALVEHGNQLVSFSFGVCTSALQNSIPFLLEHPEDLGMTADGHTPASIWQLPEAVTLFEYENVMTFAIYQCQYGASTPKPTRFLSSITATGTMRFMGPPSFDSSDKYLGPLPKYCGHHHKQRLLGSVNTSTSAAYPADLCKAIATWTFSVFDGGGALSRPLAQASEARFQFPARDVVASPEAEPAEHLAAECLRNGRISQDQLFHMSELLPDEDRVRRADKPVEGQCSFTSGAYVHSDRTGLRRNTRIFPLTTELLARLISCSFPDRPFTSLALFRDLKQPPHRDSTNGPYDNLLLACSGFSGGGLWVEFEGGSVQRLINGTWLSGNIIDWDRGQLSFDPHRWHCTEDWEGCRLVLAGYCIANDVQLRESDRDTLSDLFFELPGRRKRSQLEPPSPAEPCSGRVEVEDLPYSELKSGCEGPPLVGEFAGATDEFVDGFGRCSPGRWKPTCRGRTLSPDATAFARQLKDLVRGFVLENVPDLAKATFRLATGHWDGPLFEPEPLNKLREDWFNMLPDPLRAREMIPYQPFYLRAMAQTLRILEDPDFRIIEEGKFCFVNGVEVGHTKPLGPAPQVFRARRKDQKYDDSAWQPLMENYRDGPEVEKSLEEAFAKEEADGRMFPLSLAEAQSRYPGDTLRIAAQAVIPKPDQDFRVVHDGTHGVQVNNQIVMLDRLESPGAREVSAIQRLGMVSDEKVLFGLVGDVKKAHRRYLHHPEHWGVLACRTRGDSSVVWVNRTGTFGIASAAYWFARIIGLVGRLSLRVLLQSFVFMLIYADDLHVLSGGRDRWLNLWMSLALLCMQGTPFSERKWRGGLQLDWVGYWIDYGRFKLGISERRCLWIVQGIEAMEGNGWLVDVRRFHELHGRLGFMSQVLCWIRPFLAPGYAWLAAVRKGAVLSLPNLVRCVLRFIADRLRRGSRTYESGRLEKECGELFRTDAACNEDSIVLGGWFLHKGPDSRRAPWFQITLSKDDVPWLFKKDSGSSWASTSAEVLASLAALHLLRRDFKELWSVPGHIRASFCGGTDNKSAEALSCKLLTTRVPLMFVVMEFVTFCDGLGFRCNLSWRPRDSNQEADRITKHIFTDFDTTLRIPFSWSEMDLSVLPSLLRFASFQSELDDLKASLLEKDASPVARVRFEKSQWG